MIAVRERKDRVCFLVQGGLTYEIEEETVGLGHKREAFKHVEG